MSINKFLNYFIATVWLANGLFCKVLNMAPRHQAIVARISGNDHAVILTRLIGLAEITMTIWIISGRLTRLNVITQIAVIVTMNIIEFILAPDLLLWGRFNLLFAFLFIFLIGFNEYYLRPKLAQQS